MEAFNAFALVVTLIGFVIGCVLIIANIVGATLRFLRRGERPSEFAAGIVHSLLKDSDAWDYDKSEDWLISDKALLAICIKPGVYFGKVCTRQHLNIGSDFMAHLAGKDRRAFVAGLIEWRARTAIDRQHRIERWKREAMAAMA